MVWMVLGMFLECFLGCFWAAGLFRGVDRFVSPLLFFWPFSFSSRVALEAYTLPSFVGLLKVKPLGP